MGFRSENILVIYDKAALDKTQIFEVDRSLKSLFSNWKETYLPIKFISIMKMCK